MIIYLKKIYAFFFYFFFLIYFSDLFSFRPDLFLYFTFPFFFFVSSSIDSKSCVEPTLVESDMNNKPIELQTPSFRDQPSTI